MTPRAAGTDCALDAIALAGKPPPDPGPVAIDGLAVSLGREPSAGEVAEFEGAYRAVVLRAAVRFGGRVEELEPEIDARDDGPTPPGGRCRYVTPDSSTRARCILPRSHPWPCKT